LPVTNSIDAFAAAAVFLDVLDAPARALQEEERALLAGGAELGAVGVGRSLTGARPEEDQGHEQRQSREAERRPPQSTCICLHHLHHSASLP